MDYPSRNIGFTTTEDGVDIAYWEIGKGKPRLLEHSDATIRERAAISWCEWEDAVVSTSPNAKTNPRYADPEFRMAFARLVTHYFTNAAWLDDGQLIAHADKLAGIFGVLVHGRLDLSSPLITAWQLSHAWPDADLIIADRSGHSVTDPDMLQALVAATDRFAEVS